MTPSPSELFRPEPEINLEMPTPWPVRISHAVRDLREGLAFIRAAYRRTRASDIEIKMLTRALVDGLECGELVEDDSFTWQAPVWHPSADGKSMKTREPRHYRAFVHRRGPHFHTVRQA